MARLRPLLVAAGAAIALAGLLFIGQGLGYVRWPASSLMIGQDIWVNRGSAIAVAGLLLVLAARRLR